MQQVNSGIAYLLWCLCFFGVCGIHRFYTGNIVSGLLYLVTFGFFGIGQFIDLFLIPGLVQQRNIYLRGLNQPSMSYMQPSLSYSAIPPAEARRPPMQRLLRAAKEHGGELSLAQAAMYTELEPDVLNQVLIQAQRLGYAEITNDPTTGAIRYKFDL